MEKVLTLNSNDEAIALYGSLDENLRYAEKEFHVRISARNHRLKIVGDSSNVEKAYAFFSSKLEELRHTSTSSRKATKSPKTNKVSKTVSAKSDNGNIRFFHRGKIISARGTNQQAYLEAIAKHDIVFGIGPAGTGKTYLAMAAAIDHLKRQSVNRIVITRPAVEAGENLGFLPGDLYEKVNPYLRPLYDSLHDMMDYDEVSRFFEKGLIEVAPLAYMRGRTLNDSFVVLDEAQNCTQAQMKMFLTRIGSSSKTVVTGDDTQVDLPKGKISGLVEAKKILSKVRGIQFVQMTDVDVVRHPLVQEIIKAYAKYENH